MEFRLSETDRKHYGLTDEWITYEYDRFTNREADLLESGEPDGPGIRPQDWLEALRGEIVEVNGVPMLDDKTGQPLKAPTERTLDAVFWLGLRRVGTIVAWADWEYDRLKVDVKWREETDPEEGEPGKGEPAEETSPG